MAKLDPKPDDLYERDFYAWTQEQAAKLRARGHNAIDWENVAEEIASLGRSDRREIRNRLAVVIMHLLKWRHQPEKRSASWKRTLIEQRRQLNNLLRESPSLRSFPASIVPEDYEFIRSTAADETGLEFSEFPDECPFSIEEILDAGFLPEGN